MELRDQIQTTLKDQAFDTAWKQAETIEGWMTHEQGALLWSQASLLTPGARIIEIGSFRARSLTILGQAADSAVTLIAIDPHAGNDRGPQQWEGTEAEGQSDNDIFWSNLTKVGVNDRITHLREFSQDAHELVAGDVELLYIDGAHGYGPALDDLRRWGDRVQDNGVMLVHDCYSSIGVTLALLRCITFSRRWEYLGRTNSMAAWRRMPSGGLSQTVPSRVRSRSVLRQLGSLGWFARNVAIKAAMIAKLRPVAKALGSDGETWPY